MEHLVKFIKSDFLRHSAQPGQGHLLNGLRNHWTDERGPARDSDSNGESLGESTGESKLRIKSGPEHHLGISVWLVRRFLSVAFRTWLVKHPLKIHDLLSPRWTPNGKWTSILGVSPTRAPCFERWESSSDTYVHWLFPILLVFVSWCLCPQCRSDACWPHFISISCVFSPNIKSYDDGAIHMSWYSTNVWAMPRFFSTHWSNDPFRTWFEFPMSFTHEGPIDSYIICLGEVSEQSRARGDQMLIAEHVPFYLVDIFDFRWFPIDFP